MIYYIESNWLGIIKRIEKSVYDNDGLVGKRIVENNWMPINAKKINISARQTFQIHTKANSKEEAIEKYQKLLLEKLDSNN